MIVPIIIDTNDLMRQFSASKQQVDQICDNIAKTLAFRYYQTLEEEVQNSLHRSKQRYLSNIHLIDSGRMEGTVLLDYSKDKLIRMIEEGVSPFDLKGFLLSSPKAHTGKNGKKYITVPFRWGAPEAIAESDVFAGKMPREVYDEVRKMDSSKTLKGGGLATSGLRANQLPQPLQQPQTRRQIADSRGKVLFKEYQHKTSIYAGIRKETDAATGQNRYFSYRRVSENSDSDAFIHPGIEKHNLMRKALARFDKAAELSRALDVEWSKLGF